VQENNILRSWSHRDRLSVEFFSHNTESPVGTKYPAPQKLPREGAALAAENYFFGRLPQENAENFHTTKYIVIDNQYIVLTYFVDFKDKNKPYPLEFGEPFRLEGF
jgi:hypothetical protein